MVKRQNEGQDDPTSGSATPTTPPAADTAPPAAAAPAPIGAESAALAAPPAAPAASASTAAEQEFDITLKSNDDPARTQTVVAHGMDPGLAAQTAMRQHPGWTAEHEKTHPHEETHPADTTHGTR